MAHEDNTTLQHTRRSGHNLDQCLEMTFELKETTTTHEEVTTLHRAKSISKSTSMFRSIT